MKWYGVIVRSGWEKSFIKKFVKYIEVYDLNDLVGRIESRKVYENYVFIEMELCNEVIKVIREVGGNFGFVRFDNEIKELSEKDVKLILSLNE